MKETSSMLNHPGRMPRTAAEWIGRLNAADCTHGERTLFEQWLGSSAENRSAFERCEKVWAMPARLASHSDMFAKLVASADAVPDRTTSASSRDRRHRWAMALAAGAACIAVGAGWFLMRDAPDVAHISTAPKEQRSITLSDGSTVTLNGRTTISASFTPSERRVEMLGGEAFFHVGKDPARPFIVAVGNSEIRVVGTQFNVRQANGELEVVVREGKVNVVPDSTVAPAASVPRVELTPGNSLRVTSSDNQVVVVQVDPERLTSWRTGMIKFDSVALSEVIEDVNRYADKPLVIANDALRALPISGRFRVGDTESVRFLLRERFEVESSEEAERIVLR
jgi:transmembrane sensor